MFLVGNQQMLLDDKNRIRLPAKYREELDTNKYLLMPGTDGGIFLYPASEGNKMIAAISDIDSPDPDISELVRSLTEFAAKVEADSQGRFMLPDDLMEICGIVKNVRIVGAISKVEIWSEEKYLERRKGQDLSAKGFNERYRKIHEAMSKKQ